MQAVLEKSKFALTGWKVMAELPNPVNFEAATASITPGQVRAQVACGPDASAHLKMARQYAEAGFDRLVTMNMDRTRTASSTSSLASWPGHSGN